MFFDLFGGIWGYAFTIAIIAIGMLCVEKLDISFKSDSVSDGKLAYHACVTMELLIEIKMGTYRQYGAHILSTDTGKHLDLYNRFVQFYPEYRNKYLEKLAKIEVKHDDMFD